MKKSGNKARISRDRRVAAILLTCTLAASTSLASPYTYTKLNTIVLDTDFSNFQSGESIYGPQVFGWDVPAGAVIWSANSGLTTFKKTSLPAPGGGATSYGSSSDGVHQTGDAFYTIGGTTVTHAVLWTGATGTAVDLNPTNLTGISATFGRGVSGTLVVGAGTGAATTGNFHAMLWHGTANSAVDLNPTNLSGFTTSFIWATSASTQVGYGSGTATSGNNHALMWSGTANSAVDLNPTNLSTFTSSQAEAISANQIVGDGSGPSFNGNTHALLWTGGASSAVDLNPSSSGFLSSFGRGTNQIAEVGYAQKSDGINHAIVWFGSSSSFFDLNSVTSDPPQTCIATSIDPWGNVTGYINSKAACWYAADLYRGNTSAWNSSSNWISGVPSSGSDAQLVQADNIARNVTYSSTTSTTTLGTITIDALNSGSISLSQGQDTLNAAVEDVGFVGVGNYNQSGGKNNVTSLILGARVGSSGFYNLSGGTLLATTIQINSGSFNQTGGTVAAATITNAASVTAANASLGSVSGAGSLSVSVGATALANSIAQNSLIINGTLKVKSNGTSTGVSSVNSLTIGAAGDFNLANNSLIVNYTSSTPRALIRSYLASGYNDGLWNGPGLISLTASGTEMSLGYAEASDLGLSNGGRFLGTLIPNQAVIVRYTSIGDDNLDGIVNLNDYSLFVSGLNGLGSGWYFGDFDYNGQTNVTDFGGFVTGYIASGGSLPALKDAIMNDPNLSDSQRSALISVAPEPGSVVLLMASASFGIMRRRSTGRISQARELK